MAEKRSYSIAVIGGDGIGPEVVAEGIKVLKALSEQHDFSLDFTEFPFGGQHYLNTGETLPDEAIEELRLFDAIYLGGIGHPEVKPGILERGILLKLRFDLDLYINLRPVRLYPGVRTLIPHHTPETVNYCVVRENTGGLYIGEGAFENKGTPDEVATQVMRYSRHQVNRCLRYAFEWARERHRQGAWSGLSPEEKEGGVKGKVTLCGKTNVLTTVFDLWERAFHEMAEDYPDITIDYMHVDALSMAMIEAPERFDTIVTSNMFGDIITDLAAVTQGGIGLAPSGNLHPGKVSLFEPVHGTAPQFAGQGVVNPAAAVLSAGLMLNHLGEKEAAARCEEAVAHVISTLPSQRVREMGASTTEIGDRIVRVLEKEIG